MNFPTCKMKYSISCFIPNHRIHKGHTMAHFRDAVIKPVKFFGAFFPKRSKQIVKKNRKNQGDEGFVKRLRSRLVSG